VVVAAAAVEAPLLGSFCCPAVMASELPSTAVKLREKMARSPKATLSRGEGGGGPVKEWGAPPRDATGEDGDC